MKNQISLPGLSLVAALIWVGLSVLGFPLAAQEEINGNPPVAEEADPGLLRLSPAREDADGNRFPLNWPTLSAKRLQKRLTSTNCASNYQDFVHFYPQGFGRGILNDMIEKAATDKFSQTVEDRLRDGFCSQTVCGSPACRRWSHTRIFEVHQPSANYVSILYSDYSDTGSAAPDITFDGASYNLITGHPMTLSELFIQPLDSVPKYWEMVYNHWCDNVGYKFPLHYQKLERCGVPDNLANPNSFAWASNLGDLGRLIFTPRGVSLVIGPHESGPNVAGTVVMDFEKEDFIAIGAHPSVWGQ